MSREFVRITVIANQRYYNLFLLAIIIVLSAVLLFPSFSYAFILGSFESLKGLHLDSANSFLTLGLNHESGLMLGFDMPALSPSHYPGLVAVVTISPLLILVGFVFFGVRILFRTLQPIIAGYGVETKNMMDAAIGLIFIALGFLIFNVIIDATDAILRAIGA